MRSVDPDQMVDAGGRWSIPAISRIAPSPKSHVTSNHVPFSTVSIGVDSIGFHVWP